MYPSSPTGFPNRMKSIIIGESRRFFIHVVGKGLPKKFALMAGLTPGQNMRIQNLEGVDYLLQIRKEKSKSYAVTGRADFMRSNGDICSFTYHHSEGTLLVTEVTKK
ncbi:hypothetical protein L1987_23291 [Smallanthus sonchifolius]|uniref:Uncharacterized protein n=1 Tax=Smallanthus sonchifolius TaxID=185202 RepID=A0ACB9IHE7_9ASTR|nr:hypothetical protein L1987_23291 [Smallanthus sonchifolius]